MKRMDVQQPDAALVALCMRLAEAKIERHKLALTLLVEQRRWSAVPAYLKAVAHDHGRMFVQELVLPRGEVALLHVASAGVGASVETLEDIKRWGWVKSDAQAKALIAPAVMQGDCDTQEDDQGLQHWLNEGLRCAVRADDVARAQWWLAHGAERVVGDDVEVYATSGTMLAWLLAQGATWQPQPSYLDWLARVNRADLLALMVKLGADFSPLNWSGLLEAVILGDAQAVAAVLKALPPQEVAVQLEASDERWERTPISFAAQQGDVRKLRVLQQAGASLNVVWRGWDLGFWVVQSGSTEAMRWWLDASGCDINAPLGVRGGLLMNEAVERDDVAMVEFLLGAGAHVQPELRQSTDDAHIEMAVSRAMQGVLLAHGARLDGGRMQARHAVRLHLGLPSHDQHNDLRRPEWLLGCTPAEFLAHREPRPGVRNGENITSAFHVAMLESNESAFGAAEAFGFKQSKVSADGEDAEWLHIWNADRFGQSLTVLPDGRCIQIGGEHEDGYDPDFFIFNDVIVHTPPAAQDADQRWDRQVFAYPLDVFAPTDHHSATLMGDEIIVIGNLGYLQQRKPGFTPVYALHIHSMHMRELVCSGDMPGWICSHQAKQVDADTIEVSGGELYVGNKRHCEAEGRWRLNVKTLIWSTFDLHQN